MAWTCGFPGSVSFWNRMLASWAFDGRGADQPLAVDVGHQRGLAGRRCFTGLAQMSGKPARAMTADDPVYLAQFVGLLSRPGWTMGLPLLSTSGWPRRRCC